MAKENKKTNKHKVATSVAAAAVALAMLIGGGSYAYLSQTTGDITNSFNPNQNGVTISETGTDDNGEKEYEIVPGTTDSKDPTLHASSTLDSYLYATVTDTTDGLVKYAVDTDNWTLIKEDGNTKVYVYKDTINTDGITKDYPILKDNSVSYDSSLTNDSLKDKEGLKLTFSGKIIQKSPFNSSVTAYYMTLADQEGATNVADTEQTVTQTINSSDSDVVTFNNVDFTVDTTAKTSNFYVNGNYDGTVVFEDCKFNKTDYEYLQATSNGDATYVFDNCDFYVTEGAARVIHIQPSANNTAKLTITITNCNFYTTENIKAETRVASGAIADYIDLDYIAPGSVLTLGNNRFFANDGTEITAMDSNPGIYYCSTAATGYKEVSRTDMFNWVTGDITTKTVGSDGVPA